jgi:acetyl-CoA carboxylase biotin carboxyl carrier protein
MYQAAPMVAAPVAAAPAPVAPSAAPASTETNNSDDSKYITVKSPMIGTFYRTPGPDKDAFVNVGDTIQSGDKVCIIEAMKTFNEIESEISGKIVKVLVDNASPVDYDQPLFLVDPA